MTAFYNEHDAFAAQWLRRLIAAGAIAPGVVDERDIRDIDPSELKRYTQVHLFAGIGTWSHALRAAGWGDDRPCWTGSCPCQPFSASGERRGFADERHLWPAFFHLIEECRPATIFGEQVSSKDGLAWLDLVHADLEGADYATAAFDLCAAGVGAPHIRQRLYFVAADTTGRLGHTDDAGLEGHSLRHPAPSGQRQGEVRPAPEAGESGGLADANGAVAQQPQGSRTGSDETQGTGTRGELDRCDSLRGSAEPGPTNGFWRAADWLKCRDAKWRPVEPSTFPLAHRTAHRVGRLRAYGNAIVSPLATEFIAAYMDTLSPSQKEPA